jgi:hypothetical protein
MTPAVLICIEWTNSIIIIAVSLIELTCCLLDERNSGRGVGSRSGPRSPFRFCVCEARAEASKFWLEGYP